MMSQYVWLVVLLLAVALLLRVDFIYYILYVVTGVFIWSQWYASRVLKGVMAGRDFAGRAFLGERVPVTVTLANDSRLSLPWLQVSDSVPPELSMGEPVERVVSVPARGRASFTYYVQSQQRGYYRLGPMRLASGDLFGLARSRSAFLPASFLTVYPRILPITRLGLPSQLPFGTIASRRRLFEDPSRPMGVRSFRSGDSLRQLNWKASAHTNELLVRRLEPAISLETYILLNLHRGDYPRRDWQILTEWAIVVAASLANHLTTQRQAVGLLSNGVDPLRTSEASRQYDKTSGRLVYESETADNSGAFDMAGRIQARGGREHLMRLLEQLARLESVNTAPFNAWATPATASLNWGVTVLTITARGDEATSSTLHRLRRNGFNPVLIAVEPDAEFGRVRARAGTLGFQAYQISGRDSLEAWQAGVAGATSRSMIR